MTPDRTFCPYCEVHLSLHHGTPDDDEACADAQRKADAVEAMDRLYASVIGLRR